MIRNLDPSFETFLIPTVIGEIKRYLRDKTWGVHVPRRVKELWTKIKTVVDELTNQHQRSPKIHEIAEHLDVSEEEVLEAMEMGKSYQAVSVDRSIETGSDGSTVTILDTIGSHDDGFKRVDQRLLLESVLHVLSEREIEILRLHLSIIRVRKKQESLWGFLRCMYLVFKKRRFKNYDRH